MLEVSSDLLTHSHRVVDARYIVDNTPNHLVRLVAMEGPAHWPLVENSTVHAVNRRHYREPHGLTWSSPSRAAIAIVVVTGLGRGGRHMHLSQHKRPKQSVCRLNVGKHARAVGLQLRHFIVIIAASTVRRGCDDGHGKAVGAACLEVRLVPLKEHDITSDHIIMSPLTVLFTPVPALHSTALPAPPLALPLVCVSCRQGHTGNNLGWLLSHAAATTTTTATTTATTTSPCNLIPPCARTNRGHCSRWLLAGQSGWTTAAVMSRAALTRGMLGVNVRLGHAVGGHSLVRHAQSNGVRWCAHLMQWTALPAHFPWQRACLRRFDSAAFVALVPPREDEVAALWVGADPVARLATQRGRLRCPIAWLGRATQMACRAVPLFTRTNRAWARLVWVCFRARLLVIACATHPNPVIKQHPTKIFFGFDKSDERVAGTYPNTRSAQSLRGQTQSPGRPPFGGGPASTLPCPLGDVPPACSSSCDVSIPLGSSGPAVWTRDEIGMRRRADCTKQNDSSSM